MKKISVIIPVYNVEPYIYKSLESVIYQTYPHLEIICINDGSTDRSGEICDTYAARDSRIKVIHQTNRGYSSAINVGLDAMTGDYIGFVDPDDWIELNFYEEMIKMLEDHDVDFVCTGRFVDTNIESKRIVNKSEFKQGIFEQKDIFQFTFMRDSYPAFGAYCWNKLFRAYLFNPWNGNEKIRFWEEIKVGSDVLMFIECVLKSRTAYYCDTPYYHYFQRDGSLVHSKDLDKRAGILLVYSKIIEKLKGCESARDIMQWVKRFYVYHASLLTEMAIELQDQDNLVRMQREIKRYLPEYIDTNMDFPERLERMNRLLNAHI